MKNILPSSVCENRYTCRLLKRKGYMINSWRNLCLDNISFTSADNFTHSFPDHFHEEYTIGVSVKGVQKFEIQGKSLVVEPYSIFLIQPHLLHAHYPIADLGWSFKSLYLHTDFIKYLLKDSAMKRMSDDPIVIQNRPLFKQYIRIHANKLMPNEALLADFVRQLSSKVIQTNKDIDSGLPEKIEAIKQHLYEQFNQKLGLENLAKIYHTDKYQLIRQFKQHIGVTPNTYLTILRIEKARKMINNGYPIVDAALEAGFYDQSHFHRSFLYYTGITPGNFNRH